MRHDALALALALALVGCGSPSPSSSPSSLPSASTSDAGVTADAGDVGVTLAVAPVITIEDAPMVVLAEETEDDWGVGLAWSLLGPDDDAMDVLRAERRVSTSALPAEVRARAAERYVLVGSETRCEVHLAEPVLVRRSEGAFIGYGESATDQTVPVADPESSEARLWSTGLEVLAAPVVVDSGDCRGARVAFPVGQAPERIYRGVPVDPRLRERARAAFADMTAWQSMQVEYGDYLRSEDRNGSDGLTWPEYGGEDSTLVALLREGGGRELVLVTAHAEEYCGGFSGSLFALFEPAPEGLRLVDSGPMDAAPEMVLEQADGTRTYVGFERWRHVGDTDESGWPTWHDVHTPWLGCNC